MTFSQVLPAILEGQIGRLILPSVTYYVRNDGKGDIQYSTSGTGDWASFTNLYKYTDETTWSLKPISTVTSATVAYSTLASAWDSIVAGHDPGASSGTLFKAFANAIGFTS